jgi:hypothetical protein
MQVGNGSRTELESALVLKGSCFPREETAVRVVGTKTVGSGVVGLRMELPAVQEGAGEGSF